MQEHYRTPSASILPFFTLFIPLFLSACGGGHHLYHSGGPISSRYSNYMPGHPKKWNPPGPAIDPWGPYITQSSERFHVPDQWIRAIIIQETRGYQYYNKRPVTSPHGAKGLMQIKSATYKELAKKFHLGHDVYDPHDNIMAGTGYIRTLYDKYGAPGFVAAYHGGPGTLDAYLKHGTPLPKATKNYLVSVTPNLGKSMPMSGPFAAYGGVYARHNSRHPLSLEAYYHPEPYQPTQMVTSTIASPSKSEQELKPYLTSMNETESHKSVPYKSSTHERAIPASNKKEPPIMIVPSNYHPSYASNPARPADQTIQSNKPVIQTSRTTSHYFISAKGSWNIQVGAFSSAATANHAIQMARQKAGSLLGLATPSLKPIRKNNATLYRAQLGGLSYATAVQACNQLKIKGMSCVAVQ